MVFTGMRKTGLAAFWAMILLLNLSACSSSEEADPVVVGDDDDGGDTLGGTETPTGDDGAEPANDDDDDDDSGSSHSGGGSSGGGSSGGGSSGGGTITPTPSLTQQIDNPCIESDVEEIVYTVKFVSETEAYLGCAGPVSGSIFHSLDAGTTWTELDFSNTGIMGISDMRTYAIETDAVGRVYFCGFDNDSSTTSTNFVYRYDGANWSSLFNTANAGELTTAGCENLATYDFTDNGDSSDTTIVVEGLAGQTVWLSEDDGATWSDHYYWEESSLDLDSSEQCEDSTYTNYAICKAYQITDLIFLNDGSLFATGSTETEYPRFFIPSFIQTGDPVRLDTDGTHEYTFAEADRVANRDATVINMAMTSVTESFDGEARFLVTTNDGQNWLTGGRVENQHAAWIAKSETSDYTWNVSIITTTDTTEGPVEIVTDLACHANGDVCLASGWKYPFSSYGGVILLSVDGGTSWVEYTGDFDISDVEMWTVVWNGDDWMVMGAGDIGVTGTLEDLTSF